MRFRRMLRPGTAAGAVRFSRSADALSVTQGDRTILLDLVSEQYFALDDVGACIWELLESRPTADDVARALTERYDAPIEEIRADAVSFLDGLCRQGLARAAAT